ncbi:C2H2-type domain-containing protein [Mycena chlorophos]|uniref:C2H2-type domain-containing protein n=1 Tax=Mycena chlorophos TaxID=658473 RepID=A0A8H6TTV3_MYCCL|nr:C2H2-type domain-containing protein [Mycena chlorophos]
MSTSLPPAFMPRRRPTQSASSLPLVFPESFPLDVLLEIATHCHPMDLAQLECTSRLIRQLISKNPSLWDSACDNLARGTCPPMPAYPLADIKRDGSLLSYGPGAYARWIFCGGLCSSCKKPTSRAIFDFVFNLRACSRKCEDELIKCIPAADWPNLHQKESWGTWLLRKLRPYSLPTEPYFDFNGRQVVAAKAEHRAMVNRSANEDNSALLLDFRTELSMRAKARPALQKNAEELQRWWTGYTVAKSETCRTNYAFLVEMARSKHLSMKKMMRTKTLITVFGSFNRDLEPLTDHVWNHYCADILAELKPKTPEDAKPLLVNEQFRCEYCPRSFTPEAMLDHLVAMHKDQNPDAFASKPARMVDRTHCRQCVHSNRVYTEQGLRAHILAKHTAAGTT